MLVLKIIVSFISVFLLVQGIYLFIFAVFPFFKKKKVKKEKANQATFLILIAARNEELVIGNLIESIKNQNYPKNKYKICVLPNNCTDKTKEVSLEHGVMVVEPDGVIKSKGDVLNFAFSHFEKDTSFDTYVIFDADNILHPNFLKEMNDELNNGYQIVEGFRDAKNLYDNCITGSYALFFYLQNLFIYEPRSRIKGSAFINGTGYAFKKELIKDINYKPITITEDIEISTVCAINHTRIGYASKAIFYDEHVTNFFVSLKQRKRWIQGTMDVCRKYYKALFKAMKEKNSIPLMDMFVVLTIPYTQYLTFFNPILVFILYPKLSFVIISFLVTYMVQVLAALILTIYYKKNVKKMLPAILFFAVFNFTWIPICFYCLFKRKNKWEEIKHTKKIKINDILEN